MRLKVKAGHASQIVLDQSELCVIAKFHELANAIMTHCGGGKLGGVSLQARQSAMELKQLLEASCPASPKDSKEGTAESAKGNETASSTKT